MLHTAAEHDLGKDEEVHFYLAFARCRPCCYFAWQDWRAGDRIQVGCVEQADCIHGRLWRHAGQAQSLPLSRLHLRRRNGAVLKRYCRIVIRIKSVRVLNQRTKFGIKLDRMDEGVSKWNATIAYTAMSGNVAPNAEKSSVSTERERLSEESWLYYLFFW